ncbi:MAG: serine hydrolase domain-containing protein [Verrucomicrobiota bacterium]|jgi:CubicO group peptidase (beta-lactamase class C family)
MEPNPQALAEAVTRACAIVQAEAAAKSPGLSVAVAVNGAVIWSQNFGYADLAVKAPVTSSTRFRIGSVSKPFTAAGLALLVERGQIDLDAPVQRYLPDFPEKSGVITIRRLAGHLSGIRNYRGREALGQGSCPSLRSGLKIFENDPLESEPGTKFGYSSYNWNVIGAVMESVTGRDFPGYMEDHVFRPLGMANTRADRAEADDPQRARFYEQTPAGKLLPAPMANYSFVWPAGGFLSTPEDLVRFGSAHLRPGFLKAESLRFLFTSQKTNEGKATGYGVGWLTNPAAWYHGGDSLGGTAVLTLLPAVCMVVALASNAGQVGLHNALRRQTAPPEAAALVLKKEAVAANIARIFAPVYWAPKGSK